MNTLLFYSIFMFSQTTNVISIDSALIFFNGKAVPKCTNCGYTIDSNYNPTVTDSVLFKTSINKSVLNYDKFMFLITVLKLMDDSLKTNIVAGINTKNLKFVIGKKQISCGKLINYIKKSNFKSCYVSMSIKFLKSQIEWGLIQGQIDKNMISGSKEDYINNLAQFLSIQKLPEYLKAITDTISLDSASNYFNGNNTIVVFNDKISDYTSFFKLNTTNDSLLFKKTIGFYNYEFSMFLNNLKFTEDSLEIDNIKVCRDKKVHFIIDNKKFSTKKLISKILREKNEFRNIYIFNCIETINTQMTFFGTQFVLKIPNEEFIDSEAKYFGIINLPEYQKARISILKKANELKIEIKNNKNNGDDLNLQKTIENELMK